MQKICIVEDDESLRSTLKLYFETFQIAECFAASGLSDFLNFPQLPSAFSIAILDINLGQGQPDGTAVLDWLKKNGFNGKVVFISGHAKTDPKIIEICGKYGTCFLEKPFSIDDLKKLIHE